MDGERKVPLRVLSLVRAFGGLKASLAEGKWQPAGVPAIYRLLEGLGADPEVELLNVFTVKEDDARFPQVRRMNLPRIGNSVVLPYRNWFGLRRASMAMTELESAARILAIAARFRPDIVYATYANILPAALLARLGHRGVVLRFMGVVPHHREIADGALPLFRWQLRSSFAHAVCSEDGSDPAAVLPRLLAPATPWTVRLNGCDAKAIGEEDVLAVRAAHGLGERPAVAFLARLEPYKGCLEFIEAALAVLRAAPDSADFVVIGDGPLRAEMEARVGAAGQGGRVRFTGSRPHGEVGRLVGAADIYVSTNMYGNLSNANLEALAAGACLLLPTSDPAVPLDTVTDKLIPGDVALRYDRHRMPQSLADTLHRLLASPAEISERRRRSAALAKLLVKPWAQSVAEDIAVLKTLAAQRAAPQAVPFRT
jgi:glycosyltransferase involved in cell wall biosynthesis